jgi:hypothetical protein
MEMTMNSSQNGASDEFLGKLLAHANLPSMIVLWAGKNLPGEWGVCDGQAVSRTDYPLLFRIIGTDFGEGDGFTTFNLPNLLPPAENIRYIIRMAFLLDEDAGFLKEIDERRQTTVR